MKLLSPKEYRQREKQDKVSRVLAISSVTVTGVAALISIATNTAVPHCCICFLISFALFFIWLNTPSATDNVKVIETWQQYLRANGYTDEEIKEVSKEMKPMLTKEEEQCQRFVDAHS